MDHERIKAEEDLRVIRSLMERATVYRAISAPSAVVAGLASLVAAGWIYWNNQYNTASGSIIGGRQFVLIWIGVLVLALVANTFFIWREARKNSRPFVSSGMKLALKAIGPCLLIPAAFTAWFFSTGYLGGAELELVVVWVLFYGLALLSTTLFAPRSLVILGWAFLLSGVSVPVVVDANNSFSPNLPLVIMAVTFGLYHLIYAGCTWPRKKAVGAARRAVE
jgi:hypothetical protein